MPKKKFIDKKKAVTFQLVHRSQQDPLIADEDAPQRVLQALKQKETAEEKAARIEEQQKYGIYFTDDTNYMEFLKERSDNRVQWPDNVEAEIEEKRNRFSLPSELFPSATEEKVGMLNRAMPVSGLQLHLDPDVVAAMDDDFDFDDPDNQLEDDFINLANGALPDQIDIDYQMNLNNEKFSNIEIDSDQAEWSDGEENDEINSLPGSMSFDKEETKSRCTNYSISSSVMSRNEQLQLLDKRFEKMLEKYDESDEEEEVKGLSKAEIEEICRYGKEMEQSTEVLDKDDKANAITKEMAKRKNAFKTEYVEVVVKQKPKYDCQSIISTYSNIHNRPKVIDFAELMPKKKKKSVEKPVEPEDEISDSLSVESRRTRLTELSIRDKNETKEEKKQRKKDLKEFRKERRAEKKENKLVFNALVQRQRQSTTSNRGNQMFNKMNV